MRLLRDFTDYRDPDRDRDRDHDHDRDRDRDHDRDPDRDPDRDHDRDMSYPTRSMVAFTSVPAGAPQTTAQRPLPLRVQ